MLRDTHPCKVVENKRSQPGKHGSAKYHVVGVDIFTHRKVEDIFVSGRLVKVPGVEKDELQVMSVDGEMVSAMSKDGTLHRDIQLPARDQELTNKVMEGFAEGDVFISVLRCMGASAVVSCKVQLWE